MDRKDLGRYYADNVGLIHTVARKGYGRLQGIGASVDYDDLFQELSETFIKSYDGFNVDLGVKFSTYFTMSAYNEINKIAMRFERERTGGVIVSIEKNKDGHGYKVEREYLHAGAKSIEEMNDYPSEDELTFEEVIASGEPTPEEIVAAASEAGALLRSLSPLAATMAEMAINPPDFIEREFVAAQAHAEHARSGGVERRSRSVISVSFVASVLERVTDIPVSKIKAAKSEITSIAKKGF